MHDNPGGPQVMLQAARDLWPSPGPLDSLVATRFAMALERRLGMRVPLRAILESQTPEQLALALTAQEGPGVASHLLPLGDQSRRRRSSLSFSQERMAFMQALAVGSAAYHVAFGLRLRGELNAAALASALGELSAHHEVLRLRFIPAAEGTVPVAGASLPIRMQVISASGDDEVFTAASEFCNAPFDLERGNVARAALIQRTRKDSLLVLVFHHIVMDQWSYEILLEELARAYARNVGGDHSGSTRQDGYAGYAIWHRHWFREHAFASDRSYWLEQLNGASRVSFLPDFPRPDEPTYRGARVRLPLDEVTWQALEAAAMGEQATLSMLLFATLALLLRNHTGVPDVTIGVAAANRNHVGSESCVGTLVNTLPVRARLEGCPSFNSLLRHVRQQFLDAMDHQDMPFELLVNLLQAPRQSGLSPLFGVMLNVLNTPPAIVDMPGLDVERVEIDRLGRNLISRLRLTEDTRAPSGSSMRPTYTGR